MSDSIDLPDWARTARCRPLELAVSTRLLSVMLLSGVHIGDSLETVCEQCQEPRQVEVWWTVNSLVHQGHMLSQALACFPGVFSPIYRAVVTVGEKSGSLPHCLRKIADWLETELRVAGHLRASLTYPAFVLAFSMLLTWWLMSQVLPPFFTVLNGLHVELPLPTRILMLLVYLAGSGWTWLLLVGLGLLLMRLRNTLSHELWRYRIAELAYLLPWFGDIYLYTVNLRAASAGSILFRTGCNSLIAWRTSLEATGDPVMNRLSEQLLQAIREGEQASEFLARHPEHFCSAMVQMVRAGEESGRLPDFLEHLVRLLENEVEFRITVVLAALEPLLMAMISLLLLGILLAVFLPLYAHLSTL